MPRCGAKAEPTTSQASSDPASVQGYWRANNDCSPRRRSIVAGLVVSWERSMEHEDSAQAAVVGPLHDVEALEDFVAF